MHGLIEDFYCWDKTPRQINLERGGFISAHVFPSKYIIKGSQERNLEAGAGAEAMENRCLWSCSLMACAYCFLKSCRTTELGPPTSTINPGKALQIGLQANPMESFHFLDWFPR